MSATAQLDLFGTARARHPALPPSPERPRPPPPKERHLNATALIARGWTRGAIQRFLGQPDETVEKARGGWTVWETRYLVHRVVVAEGLAAFVSWLEARDRRRQAVKLGRDRVVATASEWCPVVPRMTAEELRRCAVDHYNARIYRRMERRQDFGLRLAAVDSEAGFLARITVNYLRHATTSYDQQLKKLDGLGERGRAVVSIVRRRALVAIATTYPELAAECEHQLARRG